MPARRPPQSRRSATRTLEGHPSERPAGAGLGDLRRDPPGAPGAAATRRPAGSGTAAPRPWAARISGPSEPLPDELEQFLDHLRIQRNRPATTVRAYRSDLAKFAAFQTARTHADAPFCAGIDATSLRRYQLELAAVVPAARSRARALTALRQFLRFAHSVDWTPTELSRHVVVPRYTPGDPHPVPTDDVPRLLAALPTETLRDQRDRALVHLLISTGCRISEALSLDRTDVRPEGFRVLGKGGKHRTVYCTGGALAAVDGYLRVRGPDASPALFISVAHGDIPRGRALPHNRLSPDGARRALTALRRRFAGDPAAFALLSELRSPHAARHTAATTLLEATDGDVRLVQEVLGHATLETLRVYTEITDRRKRAAYDRLGEYLQDVAENSRPRGAR